MIGLSVAWVNIEGTVVCEPVWDKGDKCFVVYVLQNDGTFACVRPENLTLVGFDPRFMELMRSHS